MRSSPQEGLNAPTRQSSERSKLGGTAIKAAILGISLAVAKCGADSLDTSSQIDGLVVALHENNEEQMTSIDRLRGKIETIIQSEMEQVRKLTTWEMVQPLPSGVTQARMARRIDEVFRALIQKISEQLTSEEKQLLAAQNVVISYRDQKVKMSDDGSGLVIVQSE